VTVGLTALNVELSVNPVCSAISCKRRKKGRCLERRKLSAVASAVIAPTILSRPNASNALEKVHQVLLTERLVKHTSANGGRERNIGQYTAEAGKISEGGTNRKARHLFTAGEG
jgi:hypothetical protein